MPAIIEASVEHDRIDLLMFTKIVGTPQLEGMESGGRNLPAVAQPRVRPPRHGTMWRPTGTRSWQGGQVDIAELAIRIDERGHRLAVGAAFDFVVDGYDIWLHRHMDPSNDLVMHLHVERFTTFERMGYRFWNAPSCRLLNVGLNLRTAGEIAWRSFPT